MPRIDLPMAILFLIFLMLFVLVGIYPAWKRTAAKIRTFYKKRQQAAGFDLGEIAIEQPTTAEMPQQTLTLNDFEIFVLRRLAQASGKGLSRKQINADLHFEPEIVRKTLASLHHRGMVEMALPLGFGIHFSLSAKGRDFAVEQGYISKVHAG